MYDQVSKYTRLFEMILVVTTCHFFHQMHPPCDFFLWSDVKDQVYVPPVAASIRTAIETVTADMPQTVWNEVYYRVDVCGITKGAHL